MVKRIIPILFIIVLWIIFSKPFLTENKIPFPSDLQVNQFTLWSSYPEFWSPVKNPAQPDVISQIMPWKKFTIDSLTSGQIPFWNPYDFSGTPHLANYQSGSFSITNVFYFIFNFNNAWGFAVLIQPLLAGIFTYLFVLSLKRSRSASLISAVSFMFCGFITTWMSYATLSLAISFLPLALFAIEKYLATDRSRFLLLLSLTFPLSFFSGHFQISLYFLIFVASYILFKLYLTKNKLSFLNLISFSFFGFLLSAPQILPSIELYLSSFRSSIFQKIEAIPIKYLPTIIAPDFYGNPVTRNVFFGHYAEWSSFLGVIPLLLGIYALFKKNAQVIFFFLMAMLALMFSLDTPFLDFFISLKIPVLSASSVSRIIVLFSFSFSVLSAFGFDELRNDLMNKKIKKMTLWLSICAFIFIFLWILVLRKVVDPTSYQIALKNLVIPSLIFSGLVFAILIGYINKKLIIFTTIIIILLTSFDMFRFANKWQTYENKENAFIKTPIISKLQSLDKNYRIIGAFGAEGTVFFHIPGTEGYDPLYINRYGEFLGSLQNGKVTPSHRSGVNLPLNSKYMPKVFDLMGIKYVLLKTKDKDKAWGFPLKRYPDKFKLIYKDKDFLIYENKDVYPRAFLVGDYEVESDNQKIMNKILNKKFDLRKSSVIETNPKINKNKNLVGDAKIINYFPNKVTVRTKADNNSLLILSDNFYPGWESKVNGIPTKIIRADYTFRAIPVSKGENDIEFYFDSQTFNWGVYLAAISLLSIFMIIAGKWYTSRIWSQSSPTVKFATKSSAEIANGKQAKKKQKKSKKVN